MYTNPTPNNIIRNFVRSKYIVLCVWLKLLQTPLQTIMGLYNFFRLKILCKSLGKFPNGDIRYANGLRIFRPGNVTIGNNCSFGGAVQLHAYENINIGDNCLFAYGVIITTGAHDPDAEFFNQTLVLRPVTIGNNVWFGINCIILPGISVGDNAVIAAGSVVTRDVPDNVIVGGVPARIIRKKLNNHNK